VFHAPSLGVTAAGVAHLSVLDALSIIRRSTRARVPAEEGGGTFSAGYNVCARRQARSSATSFGAEDRGRLRVREMIERHNIAAEVLAAELVAIDETF
jgi:hypothetical protein